MRISDWSSDVCSSDLMVQARNPVLVREPGAGIGKTALGLAMIDAPRRSIAIEDIIAPTPPVDILDRAGTAIALLPLDAFRLRDNAGQVVETGLGTTLEFVAGCRSIGRVKTGDYDGGHHHQRHYSGGLPHGESSSFPKEDR